MNEYPRDEFDDVSEHTRREGAHRSFVKLRDPRGGLWALLICGVIALIVGALMFFVVKPWAADKTAELTPEASTSQSAGGAKPSGSASASGSQGAEASASATPSATPTPSETPSETPSQSAEATEATPSETPEATETSETPSSSASDAPNYSTEVGVYNGTKVSGLAQTSASKLTSAGYTSVRTKNWTKSTTLSAVYYKSAAQKATAEAIAAKLGISEIYQTANIPAAVSVVIGADATR